MRQEQLGWIFVTLLKVIVVLLVKPTVASVWHPTIAIKRKMKKRGRPTDKDPSTGL